VKPPQKSIASAKETAAVLQGVKPHPRSVAGAHRPAADLGRWIAAAVGRSHDRLAEDIREGRRGDLTAGLHRLTDRGYGRLRARAAELGLEQDEYTATLRCLLLPADPGCRTRVSFGVGDGGLFQLRRGRWQDLEEPADGEPVGTDEALTVGEHPFRFRATAARRGDTLLLCGAGLAEPLRDEPDLAGLLAERWAPAEPPGLAAFLADVQLRAKGYADDRTAAAVWEV
ncbi:protein phosphatase 2C domain-containing protein, partial [Streptomyces pathocidini]|uniref:protein phosphatase 2C domain-containing protein n=1 Tax=Streptomyces pathocidini TaxID=1650571 RepID=UPI0033DC16F0